MKTAPSAHRLPPKVGFSLLGILLAAILAACGTPAAAVSSTLGQPPVTRTPTTTPTATATSTATATPTATATRTIARPSAPSHCDTIWVVEAIAWIDADGDGQRGADELPLAGAEFGIKTYSYKATSDDAGYAQFRILGGCSGVPTYTVTATAPPGYRLTTPAEAPVKGESEGSFGFAPE